MPPDDDICLNKSLKCLDRTGYYPIWEITCWNILIKRQYMLDLALKRPSDNTRPKPVSGNSDPDKPVRSAIKAVTWRIICTPDTLLISYILRARYLIINAGNIPLCSQELIEMIYWFNEKTLHGQKIPNTARLMPHPPAFINTRVIYRSY